MRASKTVSSATTNYLYDTQSGLPQLVDDRTNAYLQQDGAVAQINGSGDPSYLLGDGLWSIRGVCARRDNKTVCIEGVASSRA